LRSAPRIKEDTIVYRRFILFAWALVACLVLPSAIRPANKRELARLSGVWSVVQFIWEGEPAPAKVLRKMKAIIEGDRITFENRCPATVRGRIVIHPSAKPPAIDLHWQDPKITCWGIYELKGDRLRICCTVFEDYIKESERPKRFVSGEIGLTILFILKRVKR
jgi:uncharacterized protein (TIGR03067 family)